jgi:two-component system sensor histidine kinase UhpB
MQKQVSYLSAWGIRKIVLIITLSFSILLFGISLFYFAKRNQKPEITIQKPPGFVLQFDQSHNALAYSGTALALLLLLSVFVLLFREIRIRRKIFAEMQVQKENYRITINSLNEGLITTNKNGEILFMNPAAELLTGWKIHDAEKLPLEKVYHVINENTGQPFENIVRRILRKKKVVGFENNTILTRKDEGQLIISNNGSPLFDKKGNLNGALLLFQDVTEKKKMESDLKESEKKYRTLIEEASDAIFISDLSGKILEVNHSATKLIGFSLEELQKMNVRQIYSEEELLRKPLFYKELFENQRICTDRDLLHRNGNLIPVEITVKLLSDGRFMAIIRDVSERQKAEEQTRAAVERYDILAEATSDTIWDWDIVNDRKLYNSGLKKMFGYDLYEVKYVFDWLNRQIHPDDLIFVKAAFQEACEKNKQTIQMEYRFRCADGSYKNIFDRAFVIYDADQKPIRMIGSMQDVTHIKEEEKRIAKVIIDAQEQERRFIGQELHDNVNQILAGAQLTLSIAKQYCTDTSKARELINTGRGHIEQAITEIRKLSHELAPVVFDESSLKEIFSQLLNSINVEEKFDIYFEFDEMIDTAADENIQVNLYRILQEQIKNIVKYSGAERISVVLKLNNGNIKFRISDNGRGFDMDHLKKGIGLNNIRKRVEALSGKFLLNSSPGKGCEIMAEIPVVL